MKMLVMGMTLVSMLTLVSCNKSGDDSATKGTGSQMEQTGSGSDMGSGSAEDHQHEDTGVGSGSSEPMGADEATEGEQQNP